MAIMKLKNQVRAKINNILKKILSDRRMNYKYKVYSDNLKNNILTGRYLACTLYLFHKHKHQVN